MTIAEPVTEPTIPTPPRFRWLRRWLIFSATLLLVLAIGWIYWNHIANRRLKQSIDTVHSRGEPLFANEFDPPAALPPEQNAAALFQAAARAIVSGIDTPAMSNYTFNDYPPYPPLWHTLINAAMVADGKSLALARQARGIHTADWGVRFRTPVYMTLLPYLNDARNLANLVGDAALHAHVHGDDAEAIERVLDVLHQGEIVSNGQGFLVGRLVGIGINALALARLTVISPGLQIEGAAFNLPPSTAPTTAVRRAVIVGLIAQLLDESSAHHAMRRAMLCERMTCLDNVQILTDHSIVLRPMFKLEMTRTIEAFDALLLAAGQNNLPAAQSALGTLGTIPPANFKPELRQLSRLMSNLLMQSLGRLFVTEWRVIASRRAAAISLAAQLYRADHGNWPDSLDALVPTYLPAVPRDPFVANGQPMQYALLKGVLPNGQDRPIVFFDAPSARESAHEAHNAVSSTAFHAFLWLVRRQPPMV